MEINILHIQSKRMDVNFNLINIKFAYVHNKHGKFEYAVSPRVILAYDDFQF